MLAGCYVEYNYARDQEYYPPFSKLQCQLLSHTLLLCPVQVSKRYVSKEIGQEIHAKAEPFLKWLKEAEEEESEEEESEEETVEVSETNWPESGRVCCSVAGLCRSGFFLRLGQVVSIDYNGSCSILSSMCALVVDFCVY